MKLFQSYGLIRALFQEAESRASAPSTPTTTPIETVKSTTVLADAARDAKTKADLLSAIANSHLPDDQKASLAEEINSQEEFSLLVSRAMSALRSGMSRDQVASIFVQSSGIDEAKARKLAVSVVAVYEDSKKSLGTLSNVHKTLASIRPAFEGRLRFNDALDVLLKNPELFAGFTKNDTRIVSNNMDSFDANTGSQRLEAALTSSNYFGLAQWGTGENNYTQSELAAIIELRDAINKDPKTFALLKNGTNIQRTVRIVKTADAMDEKTKSQNQLAKLLDFSNDGLLTSTNHKEKSSNLIIATFQGIFGGGKDAQLHVATELAMYLNLKDRATTEKGLVDIIAKVTGHGSEYVEARLDDPKKFALLVKEFQFSFLNQVADTTPQVAAKLDEKTSQEYSSEKIKEQNAAMKFITNALKKEEMPALVNAKLKAAGYPALEGKTMEELLERTAFQISLNPRFYSSVGAKMSVTEKTYNKEIITENVKLIHTIEITNDITHDPGTTIEHTKTIDTKTLLDRNVVIDGNTGKVISDTTVDTGKKNVTITEATKTVQTRTPSDTWKFTKVDKGTQTVVGKTEVTRESETKRASKLIPHIVVGFNLGAFQVEGKGYSADAGVGVSAVAGADGVVFPISVSGRADVGVVNRNEFLQTSNLKGNFTVGGELGFTKTAGNSVVPSLGFNINPNNAIDTIKEKRVEIKELWPLLGLTPDGKLDDSKIQARLADLIKEANSKNPVDEEILMRVSIMMKMLDGTKKVVETTNMTDEQKLHVLRKTASFEKTYMAMVHQNLSGLRVAGVNITVIPMIHAIFLGLNLQYVSHSASKDKGVDATESKVLSKKHADLANAETIKKYVTSFDKTTGSILVNRADVEAGIVVIGESLQSTAEGNNIRVTPPVTSKLRIESQYFVTGEGIATTGISIGEEKGLPAVAAAPSAPVAPTEAGGEFKNSYDKDLFGKQIRDELFALAHDSRNTAFIKALNSLMGHSDYAGAEDLIRKGGKKLKFLTIALDNPGADKEAIIRNALLVTSGGRETRGKEITYSTAKRVHDRTKNAFVRQLGVTEADYDVFIKAYNKYDDLLMRNEKNASVQEGGLNKNEKVKSAPLSLILGNEKANYREISGVVNFAQIDNRTHKPTVRGTFPFNGDISVIGGSAEVGNGVMKGYILGLIEKSGDLQKNLDKANKAIPGARKFSMDEYKSFLLEGTLPTDLANVVSAEPKAKFITTRAMLPGSECINDIYAIAFPVVKPLAGRAEVAPPLDHSPIIIEKEQGNTYTNQDGVSSLTLGIDYRKALVQEAFNESVRRKNITTEEKVETRTTNKDLPPGESFKTVTTGNPVITTTTTTTPKTPDIPVKPVDDTKTPSTKPVETPTLPNVNGGTNNNGGNQTTTVTEGF